MGADSLTRWGWTDQLGVRPRSLDPAKKVHRQGVTERASDGYVPLPGMKQPTRHSPSSFHGHTTAWLSMFRCLTIDWGGTGIQCPSIRTRYPWPSNSQSGSSSLTPSVSSQHMIPYWFVRLRNQSLYGECA